MNELGKFLKKLRLDHNEVLFDMAKRLNVSSAFLSAVENGRKTPPLMWVDVLSASYQLTGLQRRELEEIINRSIKQIRMDLSEASSTKRNCALAFARNFDDFSDEDIRELMALLEKRRI